MLLGQAFDTVETDQPGECQQVRVALEEGEHAAGALIHQALPLGDLRQQVKEHVRHRDATGERQPAAARRTVKEAQPDAEQMNRGKHQCGKKAGD